MSAWTIEIEGNVGIVTFCRPPRNFMSFEALGALSDILNDFASRKDVSVIILASSLEKYFVSHADLEDLERVVSGDPVVGERSAWRTTPTLIEAIPQPVIAAVNGQAWGGGTELSLACSLRVASPNATFGLPEIAVGMVPGAGGTQRLPRLIGSGRALELILSGRKVGAEEALRIGLVNAVLNRAGFAGGHFH
ncbi:enoyl-CoA hydratase/isomerase family protein [Henriciella aquimarina]|uniref:enoyl-CoA hydratase/isomerase family protein n=1 Tax=Henriciella aquimarina TaxID=545261 RepID=UPI0009FC562D|nr:enoyl-CoA hydratase/isomerase family protein [Henriciella aquimarina]